MLELDKHWASLGILETVDENMANAAKVHAVERGRVLNRHAMIAFGGGAPLHACRIASESAAEAHVPAVSSVLKQRVGFTRPANTTVCTALAVPECLVEIEVEARLGSGNPQ